MTATSLVIAAPAHDVWTVLADGYSYSRWVVGAKEIRNVEPGWPRPGKRLHHTVGIGPFTLKDNTKSLADEEPRLLHLEARGRPIGRAQITFELVPVESGTEVTISESIVSPNRAASTRCSPPWSVRGTPKPSDGSPRS